MLALRATLYVGERRDTDQGHRDGRQQERGSDDRTDGDFI